jgi:3-dehydroquinate dehydratase I
VNEAKAAGVDVAELRIDGFKSTDVDHVVEQVRLFRSLPVLATVRAAWEGGEWGGTDEERLELFRAVSPHVQAVDIELSSRGILTDVIATARKHENVTIISYHNFECTPGLEELEGLIDEAKSSGADIVKVSTMVRTESDVKRLASLLLRAGSDTKLIIIGMGGMGAVSRVFFPALGSRMTYSFMGNSSAPGQLRFADTYDLLRKFYPRYDERKVAEMQVLEGA